MNTIFLAETATIDLDTATRWFDRLGFPLMALFLLGWIARKVIVWAAPHVEAIAKAHIKRQESMADCQKILVDETIKIQKESIEIQRRNADTLMDLEGKLPQMCKHRPKPADA